MLFSEVKLSYLKIITPIKLAPMKKILALSVFLLCSYCAFSQQPLFRYYNAKSRKHYYTTNFTEYGNGAAGWALDGPACLVYVNPVRRPGIIPLFRYANAQNGDHYYTTQQNGFDPGLQGYTPEGVSCFIYKFRQPGTVPFLKYYNRGTGDHFYTTNKHELGRGFEGYVFVGVAGFVIPN